MKKVNNSTIGRLLMTLSWEGKTVKAYRNGGAGYENVLTAEALQSLDFLPRKHFWGAVIDAFHIPLKILKVWMTLEKRQDTCMA